jgi:deoxyribonuclease-4
VSGVDVTDPVVFDALHTDLDDRIGLDRLRALHANDAKAPLGSNRDRHDNIGDGLIGEGLGVFLAHPRLQELPAVLEVPGKDGKGPNAEEIRKLRELHDRAATS